MVWEFSMLFFSVVIRVFDCFYWFFASDGHMLIPPLWFDGDNDKVNYYILRYMALCAFLHRIRNCVGQNIFSSYSFSVRAFLPEALWATLLRLVALTRTEAYAWSHTKVFVAYVCCDKTCSDEVKATLLELHKIIKSETKEKKTCNCKTISSPLFLYDLLSLIFWMAQKPTLWATILHCTIIEIEKFYGKEQESS